MLHEMRSDDSRFDQYVKQHQLEAKETDWLTAKDTKDETVIGAIAQRLFSAAQRQSAYGYVVVNNVYVLYKLAGISKSIIPTCEQIRADIAKGYQKELAERQLRAAVTQARVEVLTKKMALGDVAQKMNMRVIKTPLIKQGSDVEGLDKGNETAKRMFILTDGAQLLRHSYKGNEYLVQLVGSEGTSDAEFAQAACSLAGHEKQAQRGPAMNSFIASLYRNAKIDINKNAFTSKKMS